MRSWVLSLVVAGAAPSMAAEQGEVTFPFMLGTNVYSHQFAAEGKKASDKTVADSFALSEFVGAGYFVTRRLRLGMNLQFSEAITNPPSASAFTLYGFLLQINYNFWGPLTASIVPTFLGRYGGVNQFAFNIQAVFAAALRFGHGFSGVLAIEFPVYVYPVVSIGITPLLGFTYGFPTRKPPPASIVATPPRPAM
jgi:hypothetical protein